MALIRTGGSTAPKVNCIFVPPTSLGISVCYEDGERTSAGGASGGVVFNDACGLKVTYSGNNVYALENVTTNAITCYNRASTTPETPITIAVSSSQNVTSAQGLFIEFT